MSITYRFTVSKPTPCPFSGMVHADGDLLVFGDNQIAFFAPNPDGTPGRKLTDPQQLKSETDQDYVKGWLNAQVAAGVLVDTNKPATPKADPKPAQTTPAAPAAITQAPPAK